MRPLNLTAVKDTEIKIKRYLENNVSEVLAEKINNGVKIQKDGKVFINKKTIQTFWKFAAEEARKQAEKGEQVAQIDDDVVFGWAIHYFEEDSIEGVLYNEDGTEYKPPVIAKPVTPSKPIKPKVEVKPAVVSPPKPKEATLFDFMGTEEKSDIYDLANF